MTGTHSRATGFEPYRLSGHLGRTWALPFAALLAAAGGALLYGWLTAHSISLGYSGKLLVAWLLLRVVLVLAFAHAIAVPVSHAGVLLHVRNPTTLRLYGGVTAALGVWLAWVVYLWALDAAFHPTDALPLLTWFGSPGLTMEGIRLLADHGVHTFGLGLEPSTPTGPALWLPWTAELLLVLALCVRVAPCRLRRRAYCEPCRRWMRTEPVLDFVSPTTARDLRRHGLEVLQKAKPPDRTETSWTRIRRQRCPTCQCAVFAIEQVLRPTGHGAGHVGNAIAMVHALVAPLLGGYAAADAEVVLPLSWQDATAQAVLLRLHEVLASHPLFGMRR